ncbi:MAG: hypothetical protein ABJH05_13100 [Fulvivirga sp.]
MKSITKKQAIMQSLEAMSAEEMEQVLKYVKNMLYNESNDLSYQDFKSQALKEIKDALNKNSIAQA